MKTVHAFVMFFEHRTFLYKMVYWTVFLWLLGYVYSIC